MNGIDVPCHFEISTVGQSYLIKGEGPTLGNCKEFGGIFILTPEGNLRRGSGLGELVISYDSDRKQAIVSAGGDVKYWSRVGAVQTEQQSQTTAPSQKDAIFERLIGRWDGHTIYYDAQSKQYKEGAEQHCEFVRDAKGVKFIGEDGQVPAEDNVYLRYAGGKLHGSYEKGKHGGTHGQLWTEKFTLELKDDNTLLYEDSTWKNEFHKRQQ
jgi:hypothetical protein